MKQQKANPLERPVYSEFGTSPPSTASARPDLPPPQQVLKIEASRKGRKGKTVTIISGFHAASDTLTDLAKQLKNHCGAGGAVKDNTIEVQGEHRQKVQQFLLNLGYQAKLSGG
jgi:translation initiation factor 1